MLAVGGWFVAMQLRAQHQLKQYNTAMQQATNLESHDNLMTAQNVLKTYLQTNPPDKYRYTVLLLLGDLAYDNRQDALAVQDYKQAVSANGNKMTEIAAEDIGQAAASAGDKATALTYFKRALALTQAQPGVSNDAADLQATVQNLESSQ